MQMGQWGAFEKTAEDKIAWLARENTIVELDCPQCEQESGQVLVKDSQALLAHVDREMCCN